MCNHPLPPALPCPAAGSLLLASPPTLVSKSGPRQLETVPFCGGLGFQRLPPRLPHLHPELEWTPLPQCSDQIIMNEADEPGGRLAASLGDHPLPCCIRSPSVSKVGAKEEAFLETAEPPRPLPKSQGLEERPVEQVPFGKWDGKYGKESHRK